MADILIRGGYVVDGSGAARRRADVLVEGDHIAAVAPLPQAQARLVIDAAGCVVTPGFVDMHSHTDMTLPIQPTADSLVQQGITTAVTGMCGMSPAPLLDATRSEVIACEQSDSEPLPYERWSTFGSYLDYLRELGTTINVVPVVGQGMIRAGVMLYAAGAANAEQMAAMQAQAVAAMDDGAIGVSTGLIYPPGSYASTEELIELVRPVGERHGFYFSHIRGEGDTLLEAVAEAIRIGRETGAAVAIAHYKAAGRQNWHKAAQGLELIDRAQGEGVDVTTDMYPYVAGSSSLVSMLPEWAQEGGKTAILQRLADPDTRRRMTEAMKTIGFWRIGNWETVLIAASPRRLQYEGRLVPDLAADARKSSYDWVFDALAETELQMQMICDHAGEDNLRMQLRYPGVMIGTDSAGRATEGLLFQGFPHPRGYGTFPRVLGRYVRELGVLSLEEAVYKMCGLPARKLRWRDRGLLKPGFKADLVIFDAQTILDRATYQAPHQYPVGISHVIVNGRVVVERGVHTQAKPGRVLARS